MSPLLFRVVAIGLTWQLASLAQIERNVDLNSLKEGSCGAVYEYVDSGEISSPNFPSSPPDNTKCIWTIKLKKGYQLELNFKVFMLLDDPSCKDEFLQIDANGKIDKRLCGMKDRFSAIYNNSEIKITYQTSKGSSNPGFLIDFTVNKINAVEIRTDDGCPCGVKPKTQVRRIIGGSSLSEPYEFPWLCILVFPYSKKTAHCGCTIITAKHIVTAAHCTYRRTESSYLVLAGVNDLNSTRRQPYKQSRKIKTIHQHPKYDHDIENYDISVMELTEPFTLSAGIWPICLPPKGNLFVGQTGVAAGWGKTQYMGESSNLPLEVKLPIINNTECAKVFENTNANLTKYMLCAGVMDGSLDACQGDSGGPLMWINPETEQWCLAGVISYGVKCATPEYVGVYTRITEFLDYIKDSIGMPGESCLVRGIGEK